MTAGTPPHHERGEGQGQPGRSHVSRVCSDGEEIRVGIELVTWTYLTEIGIRISIFEATGLPSCIAGKNFQRLRESSSARLRSGSLVGSISATWVLPSAATLKRAMATISMFRRRSASGISGMGLWRARAPIWPPPGPLLWVCGDVAGTVAGTLNEELAACRPRAPA